MNDLARASVTAVKWSAVSTVGRFALQLLAQVILARILGPDNYGIFGIGMIVYTFGNFFSSFGFGRNLLQKPEVSPEDIRFAFTWQVLAGGIATVALYVSAPALAEYFKDPRVLPVIRWLSLACLLYAATAPASNLLQRDLNFKAVGLIQFAGYALGYLVFGIPLAMAGYEVHALVTAWLTQTGFIMVASYWAKPHPIKPLLWFPGAKDAFGYGGTVFMTNIVNWALTNLDRIVIGRLLNAQAVGLYNAGYNLATLPNGLLLGTLQTTYLASGARLQDDRRRLGESHIQILSSLFVLLIPAFAFLASVAPQIVAVLYGPRWEATADVLAILFLAMPAYIAWGMSTPILWNCGRKNAEMLLQLPVLAIGALALFHFSRFGLIALAQTAAGILLARALVMLLASMAAVQQSVGRLAENLARGVGLGILFAVVGRGVALAMPTTGSPMTSLLACCLAALVLLACIVFLCPGMLGLEAWKMIRRFLPELPSPKAL